MYQKHLPPPRPPRYFLILLSWSFICFTFHLQICGPRGIALCLRVMWGSNRVSFPSVRYPVDPVPFMENTTSYLSSALPPLSSIRCPFLSLEYLWFSHCREQSVSGCTKQAFLQPHPQALVSGGVSPAPLLCKHLDRGSSLRPFGARPALRPTEPYWPGLRDCF